MVFVLVKATKGIGVKQLKAAINSKYADKSVLVMDSEEISKMVKLFQIKSGLVGSENYYDDFYQKELEFVDSIFKQNLHDYQHFVYVDYELHRAPTDLVDAFLVMGLRFNEQELRKCYLDMMRDTANVDVASMKALLNKIPLDKVEEVWLWAGIYGYESFQGYDHYKTNYMHNVAGSIQTGYKALAVDETIEYIMGLLNGTQHGPKKIHVPSGRMAENEHDKIYHSSPLLDAQWYDTRQEKRRQSLAEWKKQRGRGPRRRSRLVGRRGSRRHNRRSSRSKNKIKKKGHKKRHGSRSKNKNKRKGHKKRHGSRSTHKKKRHGYRSKNKKKRHGSRSKNKKHGHHRRSSRRARHHRKRRGSDRKRRH